MPTAADEISRQKPCSCANHGRTKAGTHGVLRGPEPGRAGGA